jgi:broad specificity phosphatase PhoE
VICSQKNMPFISQACSILKKTKCERSKGYTFNYLSVVNEKKYQNMKNSFEKDSVEVEEVRTFIKRFKCKGKNSRKWPYGDSVSLLWAARAGALLQIKNFVAASITNSIDEMRDSIGRSALHLASFAGHYDCVFFLLKLGADPNLKDNNNSTPLHYAVAGGIVSVVQLLVQHGASLKIFGSCCEDAGDVLAILYSGGEGQIRWNGALRPYDIVRRRINSLNRVSQSQQPLWTAIMFLVHPCTPTGMICSNKRNQRIFCFRHAESLWNAQGSNRLKGLIDAPLTIRGYHQCANLKQYLQQSSALTRLNIQLVVVSPLTRALETYKEVFRWYVDEMGEQAKVIIDPRISEKVSSSGSKGTPTSVLKEKYPNFQFENLSENWWYHPSALSSSKSRWEPEKNVVTRVRSFLKWISCRPESNILIIGHGHTFRTLTNFAYNKVSMEEDENYDLEVMSYEGVNELNIQENFSDAAPDQMFRCNLDMVSVGISTKI